MTAGRPSRLSRCPALGRASSLLVAVGILTACASYYPEPVEGLSEAGASPSAGWFALPLRQWLAEDRAQPLAVAVCRPPDCAPGTVVAVVRIRGREADEAQAVLQNPERLSRALEDMRDRKSKVRTLAGVRRLTEGQRQGFTLALSRDDGERAAFGAAIGRRTSDGLDLVLVVGEDAEGVEATARRVAERHLRS